MKIENFFEMNTPSTPTTSPKPLKRKYDELGNTPAITRFFAPEPKKRRATLETISQEQQKAPTAPIAIPYRDDGAGRGALYDHRSIQAATKIPTAVLQGENYSKQQEEYNKHLKQQIESFQYILKFGEQFGTTTHKYPPIVNAFAATYGLLVLSGVSAKEFQSPAYAERKAYEMQLIKEACKVGRPILSICGGSWVLYQYFGGNIKEVNDHAYRGGMPRLSETTGKVGNNKQIHRIAVNSDPNLLRAALKMSAADKLQPPVNSVHSHAVDPTCLPKELVITATAVQDDELAPVSTKQNNILKEKMKPEQDAVEAFETRHGAPILGVQWHPEAYSSKHLDEPHADKQENLISYMALAGQSFLNKQKMLSDFRINYLLVKSKLHSTNFLSNRHTVRRQEVKGKIQFSHFGLVKTNDLRHKDEVNLEIKVKENFYQEQLDVGKVKDDYSRDFKEFDSQQTVRGI